MKIIPLLITMLVCSMANSQQLNTAKIPPAVGKAFRDKFPQAQQENWSRENDSTFEVEFFNSKKKQAATFALSGKWVETETEINYNKVPGPVNQTINKQFEGFSIQESLEVETADKGILYEITVVKGAENYELLISAKGEVLQKEAGESD